jgi:hypothetical protein
MYVALSLMASKGTPSLKTENQKNAAEEERNYGSLPGLLRPTAALRSREMRTCPAYEVNVSCRKAPSHLLTLATS